VAEQNLGELFLRLRSKKRARHYQDFEQRFYLRIDPKSQSNAGLYKKGRYLVTRRIVCRDNRLNRSEEYMYDNYEDVSRSLACIPFQDYDVIDNKTADFFGEDLALRGDASAPQWLKEPIAAP
jgi:hypothetical protein